MSCYRMTLRLNLENEDERKTAEFLKKLDCEEHKSKNRFVIELINCYMDSIQKEQQENEFLEKIRMMFREEIADISVAAHPSTSTTEVVMELTEEEKEENAARALAALEMFG